MKHIYSGAMLALISITTLCCKKFEQNLEEKDKESGIVRVISAESNSQSSTFKIDEKIAVVTKIGMPVKDIKFYIGGIEAIPEKQEHIEEKIAHYHPGDSILLPMEVYYFTVPRGARLGPTNVNFIINGQQRTPFSIDISKPDILYPGKVMVEPFLTTVLTPKPDGEMAIPRWPIDGALGQAGVGGVLDLTYDPDTRTWYFVDSYAIDTAQYDPGARYFVRKLQNGVITTLAGAGNDPQATDGRNKKFSDIYSMCPGPDKQLYLGVRDILPATNGEPWNNFTITRIIKMDPVSGRITHVAGGNARNGNGTEGFADGKETASMSLPNSMTFDKTGNLYFLDGFSILRKVTPDGTVSTVLGKSELIYEGEIPDWITGELIPYKFYTPVSSHADGFGDEVRFQEARRLAFAGNGKLYAMEGENVEFQDNIREINLDTKEVNTIVGLPLGVHTHITTGTFKEVELQYVRSFDVDFDGNLLISTFELTSEGGRVYKMDLLAETITLIAGSDHCTEQLTHPKPGAETCFFTCDRIVFDQFGNLYVADGPGVSIKKITIER